jgi:hypothetical protein
MSPALLGVGGGAVSDNDEGKENYTHEDEGKENMIAYVRLHLPRSVLS